MANNYAGSGCYVVASISRNLRLLYVVDPWRGQGGLERLFVNAGATHFVAVNGSDEGPGTVDRPWATINHTAEQAGPGDTVVVRGGQYVLHAQVRVRNSGRSNAWITFMGYPGEDPILDAQVIPRSALVQGGPDNGAFQVEGISHIRVADLTVINSHDAGFTVRDSSNIDLINNSTNGTFSSGIAVWDTNHEGKRTRYIRILGNTIIKATTLDLAPPDLPSGAAPPHEALSIGGAVDFEVAYNLLYDGGKEGIDIKETSKRGRCIIILSITLTGKVSTLMHGLARSSTWKSSLCHPRLPRRWTCVIC